MAISPLFRPNASVCSLLYLHDDDGDQDDDYDLNDDDDDDDLNHDDDYDDDNMLDISTSWLSGRLQSCHIEYFSGPESMMFEKNAKYHSYLIFQSECQMEIWEEYSILGQIRHPPGLSLECAGYLLGSPDLQPTTFGQNS